nr:DNA-directed DNA polymerase [Tanacetum cinerariifolium]
MRTPFSSNLHVVSPSNLSTSNPKLRNRRRSKQPFILEESPVVTMADQRTMAELLHAPTERYKDLLRACPHHGFTELHQLDTFFNALNPADQDSLNVAAGGNLLERRTQDMLTILKNKSKFQATSPLAFVKAVEEICVTCDGAHPYYQCLAAGGNTFPELKDNIQGYVLAAAANYNQGNAVYRPPEQSYQAPTQQNQMVQLNKLEKVKRMNEANMKAMQTQINMVKRSRSLPSNTVANPEGELKAITTRSGIVLDGPTIPTPPLVINPEVNERVKETLTDPDLSEYTIKVPPPPIQKYKPSSLREYIVHQRDPFHSNIPYPSRMLKQKQQEKDEKMLKALLSNNEKLQELANTPLNENCSTVILKKLPEKLGDPGKFLIPCGFSELKYKALADLGASINLMPLSFWKNLGLPELISTRITLELPNRAICTLAGIARDVFVPVGKFTFPADFVIVDYESDPRVPLILGRPFLRTARALIDVHGEEMILRNDLDSTKDLHPPLYVNQLSGSTTYFYSPNPLLKELADELALITFPPEYDDDLQFDIESDLKKIE